MSLHHSFMRVLSRRFVLLRNYRSVAALRNDGRTHTRHRARLTVATAAVVLAYSAFASNDKERDQTSATEIEVEEALAAALSGLPVVSPEDVAQHNTRDDAWVIIDGVAYDITSLLANHPGGAGVLAAHAGRDVTREFRHLSHSVRARRMLPGLAIGRLPPEYTPPPLPRLRDAPTARPADGSKRVLVVGAGVCGTAAAALLAERGHAVTVVDAAPLVGGTALRSTAILFIGPAVEKLSRQRGESLTSWSGNTSFDMMKALSEGGPGVPPRDVGWAERGTLGVIADPAVLARTAQMYGPGGRLQGTGSELVSRERMLELEPALSPELLGATWHPKGATVDPFLVCDAYADRARAAGAQFALGHRVTSLARRPGGGFTAVVERDDPVSTASAAAPPAAASAASAAAARDPVALDADELVIATGWLCRSLVQQLGYDVPVGGTHGQLFTTKCAAVSPLRHNLYSWEGPAYWNAHPEAQQATLRAEAPHERLTRHFYAVEAGNGVLKIGGDRIRLPLSATEGLPLVEAGIEDTVAHAARLLPGLRGCEVTGAWGGTMPASPGQSPFLGRLEPGLWVMAGSPFTRGPAYALLIAEAISGGAPPGSDYAAMLVEAHPLRPWDAHTRRGPAPAPAPAPTPAPQAAAAAAPGR